MSDSNPENPPTAEDALEGRASVLDVPIERKRFLKPVPEHRFKQPKIGPSTVAGRAKADLVEIAKASGLDAKVERSPRLALPHLHMQTDRFKFFTKVKVHRHKFQVRERLKQAVELAKAYQPDSIPVIVHKTPGDQDYMVILRAQDFFKILVTTEETTRLFRKTRKMLSEFKALSATPEP